MSGTDPVTVMLLLLAWRAGQRERPRRRPGEGTVRRVVELGRGRVVYRVRHAGIDYRSFSVRLDLAPAEREVAEAEARQRAEAALDELRRRVAKGETPSASAERRTVAAAVGAFLEEVEATRGAASSTAHTYRHWCRRITETPLGKTALRDVRRDHVARWLGQLAKAGVSAADRRGAFDRLLQVFGRELSQDVELHNLRAVKDAARELRPPHQQAETRPFSEVEARALLAALERAPELDGAPTGWVAVCLYAKTRVGEATGLRWRDLDPFGERLTVAQKVELRSGRVEPLTKGRRATTVPVAPDLVQLLLEHRRRDQERGRRCLPDDLIFVDARKGGAPLTHSRAARTLRKLTEAAGLEPTEATHRLKHTSAMLSLAAGTPTPVLQRALRHKNLATTARYLHDDEGLARADAQAVGRRLRDERGHP